MTISCYSAAFLGSISYETLLRSRRATILGVTSRGIFLKVTPSRVLFLSYESYHGPLTINIDPEISDPPVQFSHEAEVVINNDSIVFPSENLLINFKNATIWRVPAAPQLLLSSIERENQIRAIATDIIRRRGTTGFLQDLGRFLNIDLPTSIVVNDPHSQSVAIESMKGIVQQNQTHQVISTFIPLLGLGPGLTPSGDDLITGFLLTCGRYKHLFKPKFDFLAFQKELTELAYQKTSLLSANLIEAAGLGQADERLVTAVDSILAGTTDPASCANLLLSWGSSSGCDAFLGMVIAAQNLE